MIPPVTETPGWISNENAEIGLAHESSPHESDWGSAAPAAPAPHTNPSITAAKPAQPAQQSLPLQTSDQGNYGKPNWGSNPYLPPGAPTGGKPNQTPPNMQPTFHDKRPDYPVSQAFQGPNPLWGTPQFQNNMGMLQGYGQGMGNSYWKNTGTRSRPLQAGNGGKTSPNCARNKNKAKGKNKQRQNVVNHPFSPAAPQTATPLLKAQISKVEDETKPLDVSVTEGVAPPSRARVDLDLLEEGEHQ